MKELSTEQKAKRYNEVLEKARKELQTCGSTDCEAARQIFRFFPELKESEDEKIRKSLINYFSDFHLQTFAGLNPKKILAWLEKQGEKDEEILILKDQIESLHAAIKAIKETHRIELEKQGEQKSFDYENVNIQQRDFAPKSALEAAKEEKVNNANKVVVEPKFHKDEWITNGDYTWKIIEVEPLDYILQSQNGNIVDDTISHVDEQFHSFTIEDAKDGDVLVCPKYASDIIPNIFIFKDIKIKDNDVFCYCSFIEVFRTESYIANADPINTDFYPATKEQRDTLFAKIIEAGYEWDADKKELKRIVITDLVKDCITQKPAEWSEEDEDMLYKATSVINRLCAEGKEYVWSINTLKKLFYWLKSLKNKYIWKPSDEQMWALSALANNPSQVSETCKNTCKDLLEQLKKLTE